MEEDYIEDTLFYLEEDNVSLFKLFKLLRSYLTEYGGLDSAMTIRVVDEMIKAGELPYTFLEAVTEVPFIHQGYMSVVNPPKEASENG